MKRAITTLLMLGTLVGFTACEVPEDDGTTHAEEVVAEQEQKKDKSEAPAAEPVVEEAVVEEVAPEPAKPPKPPKPEYTVAQENAIASAADYLDYSAFSRTGLIDQLIYEEFSKADATFGVDHIKVNWNQQAAASAVDYLDYSSFSRQGLIDQLLYEGFTQEQAVYGVNQTGL